MLKLFKYELRKTLMSKLILLGLTAGAEAFFLYSVYTKNTDHSTLAVVLLSILAVTGILFIGIQSIVTLHHDMNTKQSYMLFMTPHTNYAILGAKAMECTVSVLLASVFFFGLGALDIKILFGEFGNIKNLMDFADSVMKTAGISIALDPLSIAAFVFQMVTTWIETVMLAFLSDVIATALLKGKKFGGLVTFIFFIVLSTLSGKIVGLIPNVSADAAVNTLVSSLGMLVLAIGEYVATATIMEKKLSV